jgi:hypothetical protein
MRAYSASARPDDTAFIRTLISLMLGGLSCERNLRILARAAGFWEGVTESSRSYETVSTVRLRDLSRNFGEEEGTALVSWRFSQRGRLLCHKEVTFAGLVLLWMPFLEIFAQLDCGEYRIAVFQILTVCRILRGKE